MVDASENIRMAAALRKVAKWLFWIIGGVMVIGAAYVLYNTMGRPVAGLLVFIAGVLALFFYYTKWFLVSGKQTWPPYITPCPDYLTLMSPGVNLQGGPKDAKASYKCMDFLGVSRNGVLKKTNPSAANAQVNMPSYVFEVKPGETSNLQSQTKRYGLTWSTLFGDN